ncbi:MAG: hypothetical protein K6E46_03850 [Lachnospiraceae bacterium]|nr:hypothetical protein [Lachnospiraceae bacterium]
MNKSTIKDIAIIALILIASIIIPIATRIFVKPQPLKSVKVDGITYMDLIEANRQSKVLARHDNVSIFVEVTQDENASIAARIRGANSLTIYCENIYSPYCKADFTGFGFEFDRVEGVNLVNSRSYFGIKTRGDYNEYELELSFVNQFGGHELDRRFYSCGLIENHILYDEKIVSSVDNWNGTLTITTNAPIEEIYRHLDDGIPIRRVNEINPYDKLPREWEGATLERVFIVDKKTLELRELVASICIGDEKTELWKETVVIDAGRPAKYLDLVGDILCIVKDYRMSEVEVLLASVEHERDYTNRVYALIYEGMDEDQALLRNVLADFSYKLNVVVNEGYALYLDPEGEVPYNNEVGKAFSTTVLYAFKKR